MEPIEEVDGQVVQSRRHRNPRLDLGVEASRYASPLPRPDDLERYAALIPGAPERLLAAGEREQAHRHEMERRLVAIDESAMPKYYAGQRFAHIISLVFGLAYLAVMALAVLEGYPIVGISGAAAGLAAVVWALRRDPAAGGHSPGEEAEQDGDR